MQLFIPVFDGHCTTINIEFFRILLHVLARYFLILIYQESGRREEKDDDDCRFTIFTYEKSFGVVRKFRG